MDERLKRAAETGNIDALYSFIHHDANVFKRIDEMEFVDTPLHVAAVAGNTGFAMEMMNLKPSFARKLNPGMGFPPSLAFLPEKPEMVIDFLSGFPLFSFICFDEIYAHLLRRERQNALHIATIRCKEVKILNYQDKDLPSINPTPRYMTLIHSFLLQTVADNMESVNILSSNPLTFQKLSSVKIFQDAIKEMRDETVGVLLIVFALVLTMTYQGVLSPPGSVFQGDATASTSSNHREGKSVMKTSSFLIFYIPNGLAFIISWGITLFLLESVAKSIMSCLSRIYTIVYFCYAAALSTIAPSTSVFLVVVSTQTIISLSLWFIWSSNHRRFRKY
ncbi:hypothetical protein GOBAR_DD00732 [Gossypium barbadense]|nr:hypothetical protein GOBAR_DD00732 [Gossypium barbadense]